jgi:hypothetical protein
MFLDQLQDAGGAEGPANPSTVAGYHGMLQGMHNDATSLAKRFLPGFMGAYQPGHIDHPSVWEAVLNHTPYSHMRRVRDIVRNHAYPVVGGVTSMQGTHMAGDMDRMFDGDPFGMTDLYHHLAHLIPQVTGTGSQAHIYHALGDLRNMGRHAENAVQGAYSVPGAPRMP